MKDSIKLLLLFIVLLQFVAPVLTVIPYGIYLYLVQGTLPQTATLLNGIILPAQVLGELLMLVYLWKARLISKAKADWSPVSSWFIPVSIVSLLSLSWLVSVLMSHLTMLPNIMEQTFNNLLSSWLGILTVAVIGPVTEELLFRGAITKALLKSYSPTKAILISSLFFGVFHFNPSQIVSAFLLGLLLTWVYVKTQSLLPCILMHIANNSLMVWLSNQFPQLDNLDDLATGNTHLFVTCGAALILVVTMTLMKRQVQTKNNIL